MGWRDYQRAEKGVNMDLIDSTLKEIGKEYRPGLIGWIKGQPEKWSRLLFLEARINQAALSKDEGSLTKALGEYRKFFTEMMAKEPGQI